MIKNKVSTFSWSSLTLNQFDTIYIKATSTTNGSDYFGVVEIQ